MSFLLTQSSLDFLLLAYSCSCSTSYYALIATKDFAIFGGSFDPIHNGHLYLIRKVIESERFAKIIVIPAGDPWQKRPVTSKSDRLFMTKLALKDLRAEVDDYEVSRAEPSYAIDTVKHLKKKFPNISFTWVIGSDALGNLQTWKDIDSLVKEITFLVIKRPGHIIASESVHPDVNWTEMEISALDISATKIRVAISEGRDVRQWVPENVLSYIKEKGLYGAA